MLSRRESSKIKKQGKGIPNRLQDESFSCWYILSDSHTYVKSKEYSIFWSRGAESDSLLWKHNKQSRREATA